jgi:hypothetical protein
MPTEFDEISNAEIAVDADIVAFLMRKIRNRQEALKELLRGDVGADLGLINSANLKTEVPGAGEGLRISHFRRLEATGSLLVGLGGVDQNTGISQGISRFFFAVVEDAGTGVVEWNMITLSPGPNMHLHIERTSGTAGIVTWRVAAIDL